MFYPLTALREILSAKPAQTWLVIRTEILYNLFRLNISIVGSLNNAFLC